MRTPFTRPRPAGADTSAVVAASGPGRGAGADVPAHGPGRRPSRGPAAEGRRSGRLRRPAGIRRRAVRVVAALAVLCGAALTGLGPGAVPAMAAPQPMGKCTTSSGVVLAVDFSHWGGPLLRSCGTTPTTGYTLLNQGGWASTGTQHDGPAFICRIGYGGYQGGKQYPTSKDDPCVLTPPATAYWSYWHADAGQNTWSYSRLGAMSYHPKPGGVDLWIFGATNTAGTQGRPTFSPDSVRAHNTAPSSGGASGGVSGGSGSGGTTHRPPAAGGGSDSTGTAGGKASASPHPKRTHPAACPSTPPPTSPPTASSPPTSGAPAAATPSTGAPTPTTTSTTTPSHCPSPTTTASTAAGSTPSGSAGDSNGSPSAPPVVDADPTAAAGHSSGSVLPVAITVAVVVLIGVAAFVQVRRRRRTE